MARLSYSMKKDVNITDQESDHEMSDSDDELVKEILPLRTPISPLSLNLSRPKMIRIRKLDSKIKKPAKRSRSKSVKDNSDHRRHGLQKHIDQKHKTSPNPQKPTSNKSPYSPFWSRFTTATNGGLPVDCGCPPHLKEMKDHEMGHIKRPLPHKKDHKDDKKEEGRKRQRKPSDKKFKLECDQCNFRCGHAR